MDVVETARAMHMVMFVIFILCGTGAALWLAGR